MKNYFLLLLSLLVLDLSGQDHVCKDLSHIIHNEAHSALLKMHTPQNEIYDNYDIHYHRFDWNIDPAVSYISGTVQTNFVALDDMSSIVFDLASNMIVNNVWHDGSPVPYELQGDYLHIYFTDTLSNNESSTIIIDYEGNPKSSGFGAFETTTHNGIPVMWTLSEPYGAKSWWPCKQDLFDKIDSTDIYVTVPNGNRVASNGVLIEESQAGEFKTTYHWQHGYAIPAYLVAIAVTNYETYTEYADLPSGEQVEILNYIYPEDLQSAKNSLSATVAYIELFSELFGDYPFKDEKYGHAQFGWGGGMEHQTMSFMGGFSDGLQAHELAHQWFGDKVTCGSWAHIWLNEGFATYLTGLTVEYLQGDNAFKSWKQSKINNITSRPGGSVYVQDTTRVWSIFDGRLSYDKGSMLVHMIRGVVGDEAFFQGCKNYLNDPDLAYSYALTADFKNHMEATSGMDLTEFFNDWLYGQGYPSYDINWWSYNDNVNLVINQSTSHSSVDFFEMPVQLKLYGADRDTLITLDVDENGKEFIIDVGFEVDDIKFDPNLWLISRDNNVNMLTSTKDWSQVKNRYSVNNPFGESLTITTSYKLKEVSIIDMRGTVVYQSGEKYDSHISTQNWPKGAYIIIVKFDDGEVNRTKVLKI